MAMNKLQSQSGLSLPLIPEALCETALQHARWPDGFVFRVARQPRPRNSSVAALVLVVRDLQLTDKLTFGHPD